MEKMQQINNLMEDIDKTIADFLEGKTIKNLVKTANNNISEETQ